MKKNNKTFIKKLSTENTKPNRTLILLSIIIIFIIIINFIIYNIFFSNKYIENINDIDESGLTIVMRALLNENKKLEDNDIKKLIRNNRKNIDYKIRDKDGKTLLMYAVFYGDSDIIKEIVKYGNGINDIDNIGRTALHWASFYDKYDAVITLIKLGAETNIKDNYSLKAEDIAKYEGYEDIYEYLSNI